MDVNFDMRDVQISVDLVDEFCKEFLPDIVKAAGELDWDDLAAKLNDNVFNNDLNDGQVIIDIQDDGVIKYAFLDNEGMAFNSADAYLNWDLCQTIFDDPNIWMQDSSLAKDPEGIEICRKNIETIKQNAQPMTREEVNEFIHGDYTNMIAKQAEALIRTPSKHKDIER